MNYFDNEDKIIEWFQDVEPSSVCFPIETEELVSVFESIHNAGRWKLWKNSSGKSDPPPDFYCDELKLMMDLMRVDDHAHKNKKGKIVNPTNARESAMQKELRGSGILDKFPNVENIICNAVTDLPTEQDHNYKFYKNNFIRTVEEHKRKIALYKQNHPDFKTIFFVLDESSAYIEADRKLSVIYEGMPLAGRPHFWFLDKAFIQVFKNSDIDYVVWYAPFKHDELFGGIRLPEVVILDAMQDLNDCHEYVIDKIISCEGEPNKGDKRMNESRLELSVMELFKNIDYETLRGEEILREASDVLIKDDLRAFLVARYASDGITANEIESIIFGLVRASCDPLYDANKEMLTKITEGFIFRREDKTKKDLFVRLIDFDAPEKNIFKIVNQVEIQGAQELRIPDAIIYINGLPLVVIEFKSAVRENATIYDAYKQLTVRYTRDIPDLFKYNAFVVISDGVNNKYGSLFAEYGYFYSWRTTDESEVFEGINSLYSMVNGLFRKDRLLAVIKNFIFFPDSSKKEEKIVCRYPQYFAATKLLENIKLHQKPRGDGKGGTYFGATGCGKSYTMLFLARLLMHSEYFHSPTIVLIIDRTDLDNQLSETFCNAKKFIGDNTVESIESRDALREKLRSRASGGVYLTTIQKFTEDTKLLSDRTNIICISDEAHRSQVNLEQKVRVTERGVEKHYGFAKYLHDSLPNATYVGFTGTPIDATIDVFGKVVDRYTMTESVKDGITVNLVYEGRAAKVSPDKAKLEEIEAYYEKCEQEGANKNQIEESKKAMTQLEIVLGDKDRLQAIAEDFVTHYEKRVTEGSTVCGKAMFVCANREIAYKLYGFIKDLRPDWVIAKDAEDCAELSERERKEIKPMPKINLVMTRNKDDKKALWDLLGNDEYRRELDRQFKNAKSNFKIAIVVDMWLTGFDVPELDTLYLDKPVQQHTLIQTISRVNRVCKGKDKGLIVDYIGIKNSLNKALKMYTDYKESELEEIGKSVIIVRDMLEVLDAMFNMFNSTSFYSGTPLQQLECLKHAVEYVQITKDMEDRFMAATKRLKEAFNLCVGGDELTDAERDKIHFYFAVRSVLFKYTKGEAPDAAQMNEHVSHMVEEALQAEGVTELFTVGKDTKRLEEDIFGDEYLAKINRIPLVNTKIKILQRLLKKAIDDYRRVNKIKGVDFTKRLNAIVDLYNARRNDKAFANEVLDDVAEQLTRLLEELGKDKMSFVSLNLSFEEKAFYDILEAIAHKYGFYDEYVAEYGQNKLFDLAKEIKLIVDDKAKYAAWSAREDIKAELKVNIILKLAEYKYPPVTQDEVYKEVLEQAENFRKYSE